MKGFPNQVADLGKLASAVKVISGLLANGQNPRSDTVLGESLVRSGVAGTGHTPRDVETYLAEQSKKPPSYRSFETTARGLRELFEILRLIEDDGRQVQITPLGRQIASVADSPTSRTTLETWRRVIRLMSHDGGDGQTSHPYQVLLRLIARKPGITRAKCALALEAKDDSDAELERIVKLSDLPEEQIRSRTGTTKSNWDNAKKILPHFAEQLGDVTKVGQEFYLSDSPGTGAQADARSGATRDTTARVKTPRSSSNVDSTTIARAGTVDTFDEADDTSEEELDPQALRRRRDKLKDRLKRHNLLVQAAAKVLEKEGAQLYENPFDCLACYSAEGLLVEVKSLDGTADDEKSRVKEALAQLLYYESFVTQPIHSTVRKGSVCQVAHI